MDNMSRVLVEKETIYTEEVKLLMRGADWKEVIAFMDQREGEHGNNPFASMTGESAGTKTPPAESVTTVETTPDEPKTDGEDKTE